MPRYTDNIGLILPNPDENVDLSQLNSNFQKIDEAFGDNDQQPPGGATHIPERGKDYWTEADIAEIKSYVDDAILGGAW